MEDMKILVLSVDRDDDFGLKARVRSPIIGRKANLQAATKLALKDAEDSDTNALFYAISMYDRLKREGKRVEIATICGDADVGRKSDEKIAGELNYVLRKVKPDSVYFISDGSEDDYILPIITSRVKVDHIKRVYVRQNRNIESSYYFIIKALKDEKMRKKITIPIAIAMILYGTLVGMVPFLVSFIISGAEKVLTETPLLSQFGGGLLLTIIGVYLVTWAYSLDEKIEEMVKEFNKKVQEGSTSPYFTVVATILILFGLGRAWDAWNSVEGDITKHMLFFVASGMWWWVFGILMHEGGNVADAYIMKGRVPKSFWIITLSMMGMALILWAILDSVKLVLGYSEAMNTLFFIYLALSMAALLLLMAAWVNRALGKKARMEAQWRK